MPKYRFEFEARGMRYPGYVQNYMELYGRPLTTEPNSPYIHIQGFVLPRISGFMFSRILEFIEVRMATCAQLDSMQYF